MSVMNYIGSSVYWKVVDEQIDNLEFATGVYTITPLPYQISNGEITGYTGTETHLEIPATYSIEENVVVKGEDYTITAIGTQAFYQNQTIQSISIPETVTSIGDNAFSFSSLTEINIPDSVTNLGIMTFYSCSSLNEVILPSELTTIPQYSFYGCTALKNIDLPSKIKVIDNQAFRKSGLESIDLSGVETINSTAFTGAKLKTLTIPESVTSMASNTFNSNTELESVSVLANIATLPSETFASCSNLKTVDVGVHITEISSWAFGRCTALETVYLRANSVVNINENTFIYVTSDFKVYVPDGLYDSYISDANWSTYSSRIRRQSEIA